MEQDSKMLWGMVLCGVVVLSASGAYAGVDKPAAGKDEVSQLKAQVAELQGKIAGLEQKLSEQSAPPAPVHAAAVVVPAGFGAYNDPFAAMQEMEQNMQAMMGQNGMGVVPSHNSQGLFSPDYDIKDNGSSYVMTFDMPGMDKSKINVEVKDGVLQVSGERSSESQSRGDKMYRQQRSFGYFSRSIMLPKDAKPEGVQAKYENGVLTVTVDKKEAVPKKEAAQKVDVK
ncbi:MAG: Hsp20/alpha crystallin family protein [Candidatus Omnitrophica bacterium]|nr:Hsp20/alpha crystallin family protein [Candidatus Omnitrophota bacterium]